jgi:uncharacterized protein (DUF58 family)
LLLLFLLLLLLYSTILFGLERSRLCSTSQQRKMRCAGLSDCSVTVWLPNIVMRILQQEVRQA